LAILATRQSPQLQARFASSAPVHSASGYCPTSRSRKLGPLAQVRFAKRELVIVGNDAPENPTGKSSAKV